MEKERSIEELPTLGLAELRAEWRTLGSSRPQPRLKRLLVRELAWRLQARAHGGLDAETQRLLRQIVRAARVGSTRPGRRIKKQSRPRRKLGLQAGSKLVRVWRGRTHEVTVLEGPKRFSYLGESYDSLTQIAEKITSAHWSGPRFFGLDRLQGIS